MGVLTLDLLLHRYGIWATIAVLAWFSPRGLTWQIRQIARLAGEMRRRGLLRDRRAKDVPVIRDRRTY